MKNLTILGSTGSIGKNTLEIVRQFPDRFRVIALGAGKNLEPLKSQIDEFRPTAVSVLNEEVARELGKLIETTADLEIYWGEEGYKKISSIPDVDMVVSAIVGGAGFAPTVAAIEAGKDIALANKETLVMGGEIVTRLVKEKGVQLLPVDSEHSAIFQCLQGNRRDNVRKILLTASGGPFRKYSKEEMDSVTPDDALNHPTWAMGSKITIDSSTLMNKGLEVIEAHWLFDVAPEQIQIHIHPESIIHSMVEYIDGSVIAQLGIPDMKTPIAYALAYPDRLPIDNPPLDLFALKKLTFYEPDFELFPCLRLAYEALKAGGTMPAVLNAANEVAVEAFLTRKIPFLAIPEVIELTMQKHQVSAGQEIDEVLGADRWARETANTLIEEKYSLR
ncbi:MAG TPA: 1-deoxy-D-xylulose-5-phosphate reductoisomerase [Deltaproteobacteria bacterium]|nr:1-deoxy-D-xylulose-5-phosphate reductoisomerase [Deltaproteobacteria bacterium]